MRIGGVPLNEIVSLTMDHIYLAGLPLVIGLILAIPLGWLALRRKWLYAPVIAGTGLLYTIPSLALFILLPGILGTQILDPINVVVAMTFYTIALLTRTVADGLSSVPDHVRQAATSMGFSPLRRLFAVELPLAVPVISAGLRVAAVSNVSIVSVAALVGVQQLGTLFTEGFNRNAMGPILVGVIACVVLALVFDAIILVATKALTPWQRAGA
ncbi:ABC transporter permease subunit [soil metagenome]